MDRQLIVAKEHLTILEIRFDYLSQTTAKALILANGIEYIREGVKTAIPLYLITKDVEHQLLDSIEQIQEFDRSFVAQLDHPDLKSGDEGVEFTYHHLHYRYVLGATVGIADIQADLIENKKELVFVSSGYINLDTSLPSNSLEINIVLLNRLLHSLGLAEGDFRRTDPR